MTLVARLASGGMRDAESMLDQLLSAGTERLTADAVRELLGIVDAETVDGFIDALVRGDALAGLRTLQDLEDRGRDLRAFLNQVVDRLREQLVGRLTDAEGAGAHGRRDRRCRAPARRDRCHADGTRRAALPAGARAAHPGNRCRVRWSAGLNRRRARCHARCGTTAPDAAGRRPTRPCRSRRPHPSLQPSGLRPDRPREPVAPAPVPSRAAAPKPPAAPPPATPLESTGSGGLDDLLRHWPDIVVHISKGSPATRPLIIVCRPIAVDGNVVTLGFPESQAFLKDVAERRRPILEEGVGRFLGHAVTVRCVATNVEIPDAAPADPDADRLLVEARRIFGDDLVDIGEVS